MLESFSQPVPSSTSEYPTLLELPPFDASHSAMVEMRAVTICMLDRIRAGINARLGVELSLPQVLESSTWKGGREIAKKLRPETAGPRSATSPPATSSKGRRLPVSLFSVPVAVTPNRPLVRSLCFRAGEPSGDSRPREADGLRAPSDRRLSSARSPPVPRLHHK